jgi:hypothetical protein
VHCAIHQFWQKEFGAEIVDHGCETSANLAAMMLNAEVWHFLVELRVFDPPFTGASLD